MLLECGPFRIPTVHDNTHHPGNPSPPAAPAAAGSRHFRTAAASSSSAKALPDLVRNPFGWNRHHHVLYVEQPAESKCVRYASFALIVSAASHHQPSIPTQPPPCRSWLLLREPPRLPPGGEEPVPGFLRLSAKLPHGLSRQTRLAPLHLWRVVRGHVRPIHRARDPRAERPAGERQRHHPPEGKPSPSAGACAIDRS